MKLIARKNITHYYAPGFTKLFKSDTTLFSLLYYMFYKH